MLMAHRECGLRLVYSPAGPVLINLVSQERTPVPGAASIQYDDNGWAYIVGESRPTWVKTLQASKVFKAGDKYYFHHEGKTTWHSSILTKYDDNFPELKVEETTHALQAHCCHHDQNGAYIFWDLRIFQDRCKC